MRLATALCVAMSVMCVRLCAGEITGDQLREAFISFTQKAEHTTLDEGQLAKMREELAKMKADPFLQRFVFEGDRLDREMLMDSIGKNIQALRTSGFLRGKVFEFASDRGNLKDLSDAELVVAFRFVEQGVSKHKPNK